MRSIKITVSFLLSSVMLFPYIGIMGTPICAKQREESDSFSFMSFNAEHKECENIISSVNTSSPMIFTVVAANTEQLSMIEQSIYGYESISENQNSSGQTVNAIFYRDTFNCIKSKNVSLSDTPDKEKPDNTQSGSCSYAILRHPQMDIPVVIFAATISKDKGQLMYLYSKYQCYRDYYPTILSINEESKYFLSNFDNTGLSKLLYQEGKLSVISSNCFCQIDDINNKLKIEVKEPGRRINTSGKYIALTYDDGPCGVQGRTDEIFEILDKYNVKATFFVLGSRIIPTEKKQRSLLKTAYRKGFEIGNHTYSHESYPRLILRGEMQNQITETDNLIKDVCGGAGATLLRPPGGIVNSKADLDRPIINWSIDTLDWNPKQSFEGIVNSVTENAKSGKIILMHDINKRSAPATEKIINKLINQGYNFVTVSELMEFSGIDMWAGYIYTDANHEKRTTFCN